MTDPNDPTSGWVTEDQLRELHGLPTHAPEVRETSRTWDDVTGAAERRSVLLARERDAARTAEREASAQRVYAWAASLTNEHDRLVAAKAAEVVLDPTR